MTRKQDLLDEMAGWDLNELEDEDGKSAFQVTLDAHRTTLSRPDIDPDEEASLLRLSRQKRIPVEVLRGNEEYVGNDIGGSVIEANQPVIKRAQLDPILAPVIKDDLESLTALERQYSSIATHGETGRLMIRQSELARWQMNGTATPKELRELDWTTQQLENQQGVVELQHQ